MNISILEILRNLAVKNLLDLVCKCFKKIISGFSVSKDSVKLIILYFLSQKNYFRTKRISCLVLSKPEKLKKPLRLPID